MSTYYKFIHKNGGPTKYIKTDTQLPRPNGVVFYTDELTGSFIPIDHDEYYQPVEITEHQYNLDSNDWTIWTSPVSTGTQMEFKIKCECGLEITNKGGRHSTWCVKWSQDE